MSSTTQKFPLKFPLGKFQTQWYRILLARRLGNLPKKNLNSAEKSYTEICHVRYLKDKAKYNRQFRQEIEQLSTMQPKAIDAMRFYRFFSVTTLWPPLHSRNEINWTLQELEKVLNAKERRKLQILMER